MRKIAIANRKGGVAKTTTAVHLTVALTSVDQRVLLIDTFQNLGDHSEARALRHLDTPAKRGSQANMTVNQTGGTPERLSAPRKAMQVFSSPLPTLVVVARSLASSRS